MLEQIVWPKGTIASLIEAIRDSRRAEWEQFAEQFAEYLLAAGENGILVPANIVLDAYARGKAR